MDVSNEELPNQGWTPADQPPNIKPGTLQAVIVARQSDEGKWHVFGAWYLQDYVIVWTDGFGDGSTKAHTGFFVDSKHYEYGDYYEQIDIQYWQSMPDPPEANTPAR